MSKYKKKVQLSLAPLTETLYKDAEKACFCFENGPRRSYYCGYCFLLSVTLYQLLPVMQVMPYTERSSVEAGTHRGHDGDITKLCCNEILQWKA